ncbi:MAG: DUF6765 family protein [Spirochaetales bacterium]
MNVEFHYYTVYYLAEQAGFSADDSQIIAYSSQYLDNALVGYEVRHEGGIYQTQITHHFGFWDKGQEWEVWIPFHFYPAGQRVNERRVDGMNNPLDVQPNSERAKRMLVSALKSRNLYRVGIALHTYADTWAHQNFSGKNEAWNELDPSSPLPAIGHAQAKRDPDGLDVAWSDPRLNPPHDVVNNRERFLQAAGRIYRYLATYNRRSFDDEAFVLARLDEIIGPPSTARETRVADFVIECSMERYSRRLWRDEAFTPKRGWGGFGAMVDLESTIDKLHWLKDELLHKTKIVRREPVQATERFFSSHLYKWDLAAKEQRAACLAQLADLR